MFISIFLFSRTCDLFSNKNVVSFCVITQYDFLYRMYLECHRLALPTNPSRRQLGSKLRGGTGCIVQDRPGDMRGGRMSIKAMIAHPNGSRAVSSSNLYSRTDVLIISHLAIGTIENPGIDIRPLPLIARDVDLANHNILNR